MSKRRSENHINNHYAGMEQNDENLRVEERKMIILQGCVRGVYCLQTLAYVQECHMMVSELSDGGNAP